MATVSAPTLFSTILEWEPPRTPHCSNCRYAIVSGDPERPIATCATGHGHSIDLWRLIRRSNPRGFRAASECPDFASMSDGRKP